MILIYSALVLFGLTGVMGMYLSSLVLRSKPPSDVVIVVHGMFSLAGFGILFAYLPESLNTILLFALATVFGVILLYQYLTGKKYTAWLCYAHGIITIAGFVFLLLFALRQ
jgi:drug/metabolite transporter superfamily protein YnfA